MALGFLRIARLGIDYDGKDFIFRERKRLSGVETKGIEEKSQKPTFAKQLRYQVQRLFLTF
jgi:hypothetical protein